MKKIIVFYISLILFAVQSLEAAGVPACMPAEEERLPVVIYPYESMQKMSEAGLRWEKSTKNTFASQDELDRELSFAIERESLERVNEVLAYDGANPNKVWRNGFTPLIKAARYGFEDKIRALVCAGADVNFSSPSLTPEVIERERASERVSHLLVEPHGNTPLLMALEHEQVAAVRTLIELGANVNLGAFTTRGFRLPVLAAVDVIRRDNNDNTLLAMLIAAKADCPITEDDESAGQVALNMGGKKAAALILTGFAQFCSDPVATIEKMMSMDMSDEEQLKALESVRQIFELFGLDKFLTLKTPAEDLALYLPLAAQAGNSSLIALLLKSGADIDSSFAEKDSLLPLAVKSQDEATVNLFKKYYKKRNWLTAYCIAREMAKPICIYADEYHSIEGRCHAIKGSLMTLQGLAALKVLEKVAEEKVS